MPVRKRMALVGFSLPAVGLQAADPNYHVVKEIQIGGEGGWDYKGTIAVVDTVKHAVVATWPITGCEGPTGLALDAKNHLLLSACDGKMVVTDSRFGKTVTSFSIAGRVDGNGFDPDTRLAFPRAGQAC
jgi:hypothetical protein